MESRLNLSAGTMRDEGTNMKTARKYLKWFPKTLRDESFVRWIDHEKSVAIDILSQRDRPLISSHFWPLARSHTKGRKYITSLMLHVGSLVLSEALNSVPTRLTRRTGIGWKGKGVGGREKNLKLYKRKRLQRHFSYLSDVQSRMSPTLACTISQQKI